MSNTKERVRCCINSKDRLNIITQTELSSNINSSVSTFTVDDTTNFAFSGILLIDNELIIYRGKTSNSFLNAIRGAMNTTAASHLQNASISQYFHTAHYKVSFNTQITRITEIVVEALQIPFSYYTVNHSNNILIFDISDTITITPGNYTATTLCNEIKAQMDIVFPGQSSTVTFSTTTLKMTISKASPFTIASSTTNSASTASIMLGFRKNSTLGTTATGDSALNIAGPNYLLLASDYLTEHIHHKTVYIDDSYKNILYTIPVNTSPGDIITDDPKVPIRLSYKATIQPTDILDFQLLDEFRNQIDLNGLDCSIQLVFITE